MTEKMSARQALTPFLLTLALAGVLTPLLLPFISTRPQKYDDIAVAWTAAQNFNRSGEIRLVYGLMLAGIALSLLYYYHIGAQKAGAAPKAAKKYALAEAALLFLLLPCLARFFFFSAIDGYALIIGVFLLFLARFGRLTGRDLVLMAVLYFALLGVTALTSSPAPAAPHSETRLLLFTALLFGLFKLAERRLGRKKADLALLAAQNLIPFIALYFLHNRYYLNGEPGALDFDAGYRYAVIAGLAGLAAYSLRWTYRGAGKIVKNEPRGLGDLISPAAIISIFAFNNVNAPWPALQDWHHAAEHFLPFQQMMDFGKTLFGDYFSASGCYPVLFGFLQRFILGGTLSSYYQAETLVGLASCAASGFLLVRAFGRPCALFIALAVVLPLGYTRIMPLLPFLLILALPGLAARANRWLKAYLICSLLLFLYYPLYGAAYLCGGLPFALIQARRLFPLPQEERKKFWAGWVLTAAAALPFLPLLARLARYALMMSSQTVYADGISIFDHGGPPGFLAWQNSGFIGKIAYWAAAYGLLAALFILLLSLGAAYLLRYGRGDKYTGVQFLLFTAPALMLPVIYTYALVRMDYHSALFFRAGSPLAALFVITLGALWRHGGTFLSRKAVFIYMAILLAVGQTFIARPRPQGEKISQTPALGAGWSLAPEELRARFPRLGQVFLRRHDIERLNAVQARLEKLNPGRAPVMNAAEGQLEHFLIGTEASATGTMFVFRGTAPQKAALEIIKRERPVCFAMNSVENYVLYRWLMEADYLIAGGAARPRELAGAAGGVQDYGIFRGYNDLGNIPSAFGRSLASLRPLFDEPAVAAEVKLEREGGAFVLTAELERAVGGREADFLFAAFSDDGRPKAWNPRKIFAADDRCFHDMGFVGDGGRPPRLGVRVSWAGEDGVFAARNAMSLAFGDGRLLLPLGANPWWLTGEAKRLKMEISGEFAAGENIALRDFKFLRFKPTAPGAL